jgi:DNA-binding response OmpR family regulator
MENHGDELMAEVMLVEDDQALAAIIRRELETEHYRVRCSFDGAAALRDFSAHTPDLIILDWMLPHMDGLSVLKEIRKTSFIPVLMLTARCDEVDRVVGLEVGADDYLDKPFNMRELLARIHALLRRVEHTRKLLQEDQTTEKPLHWKSIFLDPLMQQATYEDQPMELSALEFRLLYLFLSNPGRIFTRRYLMATIWEQEFLSGDRSVDNAILRLRKKMGESGEMLETVRGMGYRIEKP